MVVDLVSVDEFHIMYACRDMLQGEGVVIGTHPSTIYFEGLCKVVGYVVVY